jgi:hypothetical protein
MTDQESIKVQYGIVVAPIIDKMRRTFAIILLVFAIGMTISMVSFGTQIHYLSICNNSSISIGIDGDGVTDAIGWQWFTHVTYCPFGRERAPDVPIPPTSRMIVVSRYKVCYSSLTPLTICRLILIVGLIRRRISHGCQHILVIPRTSYIIVMIHVQLIISQM